MARDARTPEERSAQARKAAWARWHTPSARLPLRLTFPNCAGIIFVDLGQRLRLQMAAWQDRALWDEATVATVIALLQQWQAKVRHERRAEGESRPPSTRRHQHHPESTGKD